MLREIRDRLQLDRTLAFAIGGRFWQALSGPITILLLIKTLTLSEQGVYYGIVGVIGIQAYFELGLLNVLVSHSSHETAAMGKIENDSAESEDYKSNPAWIASAARMRDLIGSSFRWFSAASILFAASLCQAIICLIKHPPSFIRFFARLFTRQDGTESSAADFVGLTP